MASMQIPVVVNFRSRIFLCLLLTALVFALGVIITFWNIHDYQRMREDDTYQRIPECACRRKFIFPKRNRARILSSCSDEGTWYEPFQNVVSFSYYNIYNTSSNEGTAQISLYKTGLLENLHRMRKFYPGYQMRVYTNASLEQGNPFCDVLCTNPDVHWCKINDVPGYRNLSSMHPMTWRFLPLGDSTVDVFLSRDIDSVITEREVAAVQDWLHMANTSGGGGYAARGIQLMRDHPSHNYPILGGLWGASNKVLGKMTAKTLQRLLVFWSKHPSIVKRQGFDQSLLNVVIFRKRPELIVTYDSYHCLRWRHYTLVRPFPVRRKDSQSDFTGNPNLGRGIYTLEPCPVACRPEKGKDWEFC